MRQRRTAVLFVVAAVMGVPLRGSAADSTDARLRRLEQQLRDAQQEINRLRDEVRQQKAISQGTQTQIEENRKTQEDAIKTASKGVEMPDWLKRTTLFGDIRARHEGFYHQPHAGGADIGARNRERIRARFGLKVAFSDEISGTIRLASGNIDDPISTNETLTGVFNRKHINLDWAFLTLTPGKSFGIRPGAVAITAGKFPNPIFRVGEMVFDDDLSAEGVSETFQLLDKPMGALDQVKIHALQWVYNEISNAEDGWMFGGQINPSFHIGDAQLEAGLGQFWFLNPDQIAIARNTNTQLAITNAVERGPTGLITGFVGAFNESNADVALTFPNVIGTQPVKLFADYVYNWEAATDEAHGWMAGTRLGQTKVQGDWSLFGFYEHIGTEAALSALTYSDFGPGGTNQEGPVVGVDYQLLNPLTLTVKSHFTNFIDRPTGTSNPTLTRLQLDALFKF